MVEERRKKYSEIRSTPVKKLKHDIATVISYYSSSKIVSNGSIKNTRNKSLIEYSTTERSVYEFAESRGISYDKNDRFAFSCFTSPDVVEKEMVLRKFYSCKVKVDVYFEKKKII